MQSISIKNAQGIGVSRWGNGGTYLRTGWIDLWTLELNVDEIENALKTQSVF